MLHSYALSSYLFVCAHAFASPFNRTPCAGRKYLYKLVRSISMRKKEFMLTIPCTPQLNVYINSFSVLATVSTLPVPSRAPLRPQVPSQYSCSWELDVRQRSLCRYQLTKGEVVLM